MIQEEFDIKEIPAAIVQEANKRISGYTVGLLRLHVVNNCEEATLLGSGVLVRINNVYGIITAQHVNKHLPRKGRLGLILSDKKETTSIDVNGIEYIDIAKGSDDKKGPDLAVIHLSNEIASSIGAMKSFFNLAAHKDLMLNNTPKDNLGVWVSQGFIEELTQKTLNGRKPDIVKIFCQFGAAGGIEGYNFRDNYDYYRFPIEHDHQDIDPKSYEGTSGGGLWQVIIKEMAENNLEISDIYLRGINYFQEPTIAEKSGILCHGYRSIFEKVYDVLSGYTS